MDYTPENIQKLARKVVSNWNMSTVINNMVNRIKIDYQEDEKLFQYDSELMNLE